MEKLRQIFTGPDSRKSNATRHDFLEMPTVALLSSLCGGQTCVRHLVYRIVLQQGERMSPERIRTALAVCQCSIMRDIRSKWRFAVLSKTTPDMDRICWILGLPMSRTPCRIE